MAGDPRRYHEPEFVDNVGSEQRPRDRDTCVDADIASALLLEISNAFDHPAVEYRRVHPISVEGRRCRDILRDPVDERCEWLDLAAWPELRPLGVATASENDRVLRRDDGGKVGVVASSQWAKNRSGSSATPSRDNSSYTTSLRTLYTSGWPRCYPLTDQAIETHRCEVHRGL